MLKTTNKQTLRNLFIFSTSIAERVNQKIQHLTFAARQAYYERDYHKVALCSEELINLSPRSEFAGLYFHALANSQQGNNTNQEAQRIYEMLAQDAPSSVQSAAMLALGLKALQSNQLDEAKRLLTESNKISVVNTCAPITAIQTQSALSALYSQQGDHYKSALILKKMLPDVFILGRAFPAYLGAELNNYAYELGQLRQFQAASQIISSVVSSSYANLYPEWQETACEIHEAQTKPCPNRSSISVPKQKYFNVVNIAMYQRDHFAKYREMYTGKVLPFPSINNRFHITLTSKDNLFNLCNLEINNSQESEERLIEFLYLLNFICTDSQTDYIVRGFVSPENSGMYEFEGNVHFDELDKLFTLIGNVEAHAQRNPFPNQPMKLAEESETHTFDF
jgi:tetratricopeptide (TPR) repeat protein